MADVLPSKDEGVQTARVELPQPFIEQLSEKVAEARAIGFAQITITIKQGELFTIIGPAPSERIRQQ